MAKGRVIGVNNPHNIVKFLQKYVDSQSSLEQLQEEINQTESSDFFLLKKFQEIEIPNPIQHELEYIHSLLQITDRNEILERGTEGCVRLPPLDEESEQCRYIYGQFYRRTHNPEKNIVEDVLEYLSCCDDVYEEKDGKEPHVKGKPLNANTCLKQSDTVCRC